MTGGASGSPATSAARRLPSRPVSVTNPSVAGTTAIVWSSPGPDARHVGHHRAGAAPVTAVDVFPCRDLGGGPLGPPLHQAVEVRHEANAQRTHRRPLGKRRLTI